MMNLLKILIVDDDATVRIGLKTLIAWEQYGYRLVGRQLMDSKPLRSCIESNRILLLRT